MRALRNGASVSSLSLVRIEYFLRGAAERVLSSSSSDGTADSTFSAADSPAVALDDAGASFSSSEVGGVSEPIVIDRPRLRVFRIMRWAHRGATAGFVRADLRSMGMHVGMNGVANAIAVVMAGL